MSNTGVLARSPEPEAHNKMLESYSDRIGIWKCWFLRRGGNWSTGRKTSRRREENQRQTQPTYDAGFGNRTRDTLVGGERSHHCATPAPHMRKHFKKRGPGHRWLYSHPDYASLVSIDLILCSGFFKLYNLGNLNFR